jgi:hypothetical protein
VSEQTGIEGVPDSPHSSFRTFEVVNHIWPGGIGLVAPSVATPYWHTPLGERVHFRSVVLGQEGERAAELTGEHAAAIAAIVEAANAARVGGDGKLMHRHVAAATRLCLEVAGQAPLDDRGRTP